MSANPRLLPQFAPLREPDLETVSSIEASIYEFPWTIGNFRDSLRAGYSCWSCRVGRDLAGYAVLMVAASEAHLLNISVAAPWQERGLGHAFLTFMADLARERHCERMLLEVRQSNVRARALYERNGFAEIGMRKEYYPARHSRENAIVLERRL